MRINGLTYFITSQSLKSGVFLEGNSEAILWLLKKDKAVYDAGVLGGLMLSLRFPFGVFGENMCATESVKVSLVSSFCLEEIRSIGLFNFPRISMKHSLYQRIGAVHAIVVRYRYYFTVDYFAGCFDGLLLMPKTWMQLNQSNENEYTTYEVVVIAT